MCIETTPKSPKGDLEEIKVHCHSGEGRNGEALAESNPYRLRSLRIPASAGMTRTPGVARRLHHYEALRLARVCNACQIQHNQVICNISLHQSLNR